MTEKWSKREGKKENSKWHITIHRIVDSCHAKCVKIENLSSGELSKEDTLCIDNCVAKFFETNSKVGEKMQKMSQQ